MKFKRTFSFILFLGCFFFLKSSLAQTTVNLTQTSSSEIANYAVAEIKSLLGNGFTFTNAASANYHIALTTDEHLSPGTFKLIIQPESKTTKVTLSGYDDAAMLNAVYTFLEQTGYRFEANGPIITKKISLAYLKQGTEIINPLVLKRGIRQHINFPMDVSSYPLDEAKEYVRNLARMRFNYIVFHSYPGQWHEVIRSDTTELAGHFFYGQRHDIPENETIKRVVRNKKVFCIPEIEPFYNQKEVRSKMATTWLQALMKECKKAGLTVRLSFEPRNKSTDVSKTVESVKAIIKLYPQIDELELITEETGGWEPRTKASEIETALKEQFGDEANKDGIVMSPVRDGQPGLAYLYGQIGHNIKAYKAIEETLLKPNGIKGSLGLYVTVPEYLKPCYYLFKKYAPEATYAYLPEHASRKVSMEIPKLEMNRADWQKTMIYSWAEFDGLMYLQQNEIRGIRRLIEYAEDVNGKDGQIAGMCFNHWRTAENKTSIRYAALATIYGAIDEPTFYKDYAGTMGIKNSQAFSDAMQQIDKAGWYAKSDYNNIAFCYVGVWGKGFGYFGRQNVIGKLDVGLEMYDKALKLVRQSAIGVTDKNAKDYLSFMDNRLRTTIVYLKAFEKGTELQQFKSVTTLNETQKKKVAEICNESILLFTQFIDLYAQQMPDRGCEGTIISVYHTPIAILQRIRYEYAGVPYKDKPTTQKGIDAPPPPLEFGKNN